MKEAKHKEYKPNYQRKNKSHYKDCKSKSDIKPNTTPKASREYITNGFITVNIATATTYQVARTINFKTGHNAPFYYIRNAYSVINSFTMIFVISYSRNFISSNAISCDFVTPTLPCVCSSVVTLCAFTFVLSVPPPIV